MSVSVSDIAVELGRAAPDSASTQFDQWSRWIGNAEMLIRARLGDLLALDQERLDYVVTQAVVAHIRKPDDATQVAVSVDDGSVSRTYQSSRGRVTILDEWWELLSPKASVGAWSITPTAGGSDHLPWCSLAFGASFCSCGADIAGRPIFEGAP